MKNTNSLKINALTAGALLWKAFDSLKPIMQEKERVTLFQQEVERNEFLKMRSQESRQRIIHEINRRMAAVDDLFWQRWMDFSEEEQRLALLYVVLKAHPIAFDFHFEVTVPKWKSKQLQVDVFDYQMRIDELASQGHVSGSWSASTVNRTISHYGTMLREAGLMKGNQLKIPQHIGVDFITIMRELAEPWFFDAAFLTRK